jgi:hypothetical protein
MFFFIFPVPGAAFGGHIVFTTLLFSSSDYQPSREFTSKPGHQAE